MKFVCERRDLLVAALLAARASERRSPIPILGHLKITAEKGKVTLTGTNVDRVATASAKATTRKAGTMTADAEKVVFFVKNAADGSQIECEAADDNRIILRAGRTRITLPSISPDDFPDFSSGEYPATLRVEGETLATGLTFVSHAQGGGGPVHSLLGGVHFHGEDGRLALVATDSYSLARAIIGVTGAFDFAPFTVPREAVDDLRRLAEESGEVFLDISETRLRARAEGCSLATKLLDGTYPDYKRIIPEVEDALGLVTSKAALETAALRCSTLADNNDRTLKLSLVGSTLTVQAWSTENGEVTDEIDVQPKAGDLEIGLHVMRLQKALSVLACSDVSMGVGARHVIFRDPGNADALQFIGRQTL